MASWLQHHADTLGALASVGMLVIWLLYLHLFYRSYRDHQRPMLIIHQGGEIAVDDVFVVANMSEPPVHVAVVLVDLAVDGEAVTFQPPQRDASSGPVQTQRHQGPLRQGDQFEIGSVRDLLAHGRRLLGSEPGPDGRSGGRDGRPAVTEVAIRVVGFVGSGAGLVGARRRFVAEGRAGDERVRPETPLPELRSGRRFEREITGWLEESYERPHHDGAGPGADRPRRRFDHGTEAS